MLKLSQPITSINGFKIGDKVRLKDGDGRPHFIKSFSIDGMKEFFFEVQFEDGAEAMLDNIAPLPSNLDEAAENRVTENGRFEITPFEKMRIDDIMFGAEWMAEQGETVEGEIVCAVAYPHENKIIARVDGNYKFGDKVIVQIRKA